MWKDSLLTGKALEMETKEGKPGRIMAGGKAWS